MVKFEFKEGDRVQDKNTGEVGIVEYCSTDPTTGLTFYRIKFENGTIRLVAGQDLLRTR